MPKGFSAVILPPLHTREVHFCSCNSWFTFDCRLFLWRSPKRVSSAGCWKCFCTAWPATKVHFISNTASPHRGLWFQRWILCRCYNISWAALMEDGAVFFLCIRITSPSIYYFVQYWFSGSVVWGLINPDRFLWLVPVFMHFAFDGCMQRYSSHSLSVLWGPASQW